MLHAHTASITHDDAWAAGRDLAAELLDGLGRRPDVVLLFAADCYEPRRLLAGLHERLGPGVQLVGCTSYGEIGGEEALSGSATAMGICAGEGRALALRAEDDSRDSFAIGRALGGQARDFGAALLILLVDGVHLNSTPVLAGAQSVLGRDFPIVGGVAADDARFARTLEFHGREVIEGGAVGLALRGPLRLATLAHGGWQPIGAARRCTRVEDAKLVLELDGRPALDLYRDYLGQHGRDLGNAGLEFPLGIVGLPDRPRRSDDEILLVRAVQRPDLERGGLRCSGDVPEGALVRMTRASKDDLIRGAGEATADLLRRLPGARLALFFDCAGRKMVLGARYKEEIAAAFAALPRGLPRVGFYTYGELAPVEGEAMHHDETFTAILIEG